MVQLMLERRLAILSDAAKYDASCASSGSRQRDSLAHLRARLTPQPKQLALF